MKYGGGIVSWTREELEKIDRQTRIMMTMNGSLHPKSDIDWLHIARSRGGRGLQNILETIRSEENSLRWYIKNSQEQLLREMQDQQQEINNDITEPSEYRDQLRKERERGNGQKK